MEVITLQSEAFTDLKRSIDHILHMNMEMGVELKKLKDNRLMSIAEVAEYTGFNPKWVHDHKSDIGYSQPGKEIRFYKNDVDAYFRDNFIKRKIK